jgi:hypothetical protein
MALRAVMKPNASAGIDRSYSVLACCRGNGLEGIGGPVGITLREPPGLGDRTPGRKQNGSSVTAGAVR